MTCPACGHNRPDICALLGHQDPYKAHGAQLRVPPFATGISWEKFIVTAVLATPEELHWWIAAREAERATKEAGKEKPKAKHWITEAPTLL